MLIGLDRLKEIVAASPKSERGRVCDKCIDCGLPITVEIHKTSGGYGLAGGALYEVEGRVYAKCQDCHQNEPDLNRNIESQKAMPF